MPIDHFSNTKETLFWRESDPEAVNQHIMSTYWRPLRIYYLGLRNKKPADPDDVLNGFFASRLRPGNIDFIEKWLAYREQTGMRLRRWLMNGLRLYVHEHDRPRAFDPRNGIELIDDIPGDDTPAGLNKEIMEAFVRQALLDAEASCAARTLQTHWTAFIARFIKGHSFQQIARDLDVESERARVMVRTAFRHFASALTEIMKRDGVSDDEIDEDIDNFLNGGS